MPLSSMLIHINAFCFLQYCYFPKNFNHFSNNCHDLPSSLVLSGFLVAIFYIYHLNHACHLSYPTHSQPQTLVLIILIIIVKEQAIFLSPCTQQFPRFTLLNVDTFIYILIKTYEYLTPKSNVKIAPFLNYIVCCFLPLLNFPFYFYLSFISFRFSPLAAGITQPV